MKKSSFENKVLEFMSDMAEFVKEQKEFNKEQKEFNQQIDQRLVILEEDVKQIKLLPTIKRELKT